MRFMSTFKQTILMSCVASRRTCTYSFLQRTYSLMWHHRTRQSSLNKHSTCGIHHWDKTLHHNEHCRDLHTSNSAPIGRTDKFAPPLLSRRQYPPLLQNGSPCRQMSEGADLEGGGGTNREDHRPKREGELLKYTNLLRSPKQRFVLTPSLARAIKDLIWPGDILRHEPATIITANEGPGFMSQELLENGAPRVLALCRREQFCPALEEIRTGVGAERFQWQHADIYQMQYIGDREIRPPVARLEDVFQDIDPVSWEEDLCVKVVGALPQDGERKHAYVLASLMLERLSMFSYGRVQLNLFMTKNCYSTLTHPPGNMKNYRALSALYQVACDIKLLHTEPMDSFKLPRKYAKKKDSAPIAERSEEELYLVQITPKKDLFSRHQLEQWEAFIFVFFVRQALARRKEKLRKVIDAWAPGSDDILHEMGFSSKTVTGEVSGDDLLKIFCRICKLDNFNGAWMGEEVMGWASGRPHDMNTLELSQALSSMNPT